MTTYKYILSLTAQDNLRKIDDYIANTLQNPKAAKDFVIKFKKTMNLVCTTPKAFVLCRSTALRENNIRFVMVGKYKAYFNINDADKQIEILFIHHSLQND